MLSNTQKGTETRRYYIKMERIYFRYFENKNKKVIDDLKKQNMYDIQRKLIESHKKVPLLYVIRSALNENLIKIGESDDIANRLKTLKNEFPEPILTDVFPCYCPHALEQHMIHTKKFRKNTYKTNEIFQLNSM